LSVIERLGVQKVLISIEFLHFIPKQFLEGHGMGENNLIMRDEVGKELHDSDRKDGERLWWVESD
jgi:hypothetical protein